MLRYRRARPAMPTTLASLPQRSCRPYRSAITFPLGSDPLPPLVAIADSHACLRTPGPGAVLASGVFYNDGFGVAEGRGLVSGIADVIA